MMSLGHAALHVRRERALLPEFWTFITDYRATEDQLASFRACRGVTVLIAE